MTFLLRGARSLSAVFAAGMWLLVFATSSVSAQAPAPKSTEPGWQPLFDGKTLANWQTTKFAGDGGVTVENGQIILGTGRPLTGITWAGAELPTTNYEVALEAMRVEGRDFFAGVTFPVADSFCSLILGGWGGTVIGLSSINGMDASENETSQSMEFESGRLVQHPHSRHTRENRGMARRPPDHQPGSQGQEDHDAQ